MLEKNSKAPAFTLKDKDGNSHSLSDFSGKKVVIYFYPKDNTPGCTVQAKKYQEDIGKFHDKNTVVIGISKDGEKSHQKFAEKFGLEFLLLCDEDHSVMEKYGVWVEKKLYGKAYMGAERSTFVIDEKGDIMEIFRKVKPEGDSTCVLNIL